MVVDGVAQVGQIDAAERPVPVAAVALAAVQFAPRGFKRLARQPLPLRSLEVAADHHHPGVHLVRLPDTAL